jgi:hypothetical protein
MPKHDRLKRVLPAKDFAQVPAVAGKIGGRMDRPSELSRGALAMFKVNYKLFGGIVKPRDDQNRLRRPGERGPGHPK